MKIDKDGWIINIKGICVGTIDHSNKEIKPTHGYYPDFTGCYQTDWKKVLGLAKTLKYAYIVDGVDITISSNYNSYKKHKHHPLYTINVLATQKSSRWN